MQDAATRPPGLNDLHVFDDGRTASPCVRSGLCCKKGPCAYGTWNAEARQCAHLQVAETLPNGAEIHSCGIYDEIVQIAGAKYNPAFGAGCCMTLFNDLRSAIIAGS